MTALAFFRAMNFLVAENFFSADECARLRDEMRSGESRNATVARERADAYSVDENLRRTRRIYVSESAAQSVTASLDAFRPRAATHFNIPLSETETPQFLLYRPGDFFVRHADRDPDGVNRRAVSIIAFLNDDFEGGALKFYGGVEDKLLTLTLQPAEGLLIGFRSEWLHEVEPVTAGERFTIVSWYA